MENGTNVPPSLPAIQGIVLGLIPGLVGYAVGDDGSLWSCRQPSRCRHHPFRSWHQLKVTWSKHTGYGLVTLMTPEGRRQFRVHCLVLRVFRGPSPPGQQGRHWDGNKRNNRLTNLLWGTPKQNCEDRTRHGRGPKRKGTAHPLAKLKDRDIRDMRRWRQRGWTYDKIAARKKVTMTLAWKILNGKNWTHVKE